jgi:hypothetical protein
MLDAVFRDVRFNDRLGYPVGFVLGCLLTPRPSIVNVEFLILLKMRYGDRIH